MDALQNIGGTVDSLALAEVQVWAGSGGGGRVNWLVSDQLGNNYMNNYKVWNACFPDRKPVLNSSKVLPR